MIFIRAQLFGYDGYPLFMNKTNIPIGLQSLFTKLVNKITPKYTFKKLTLNK